MAEECGDGREIILKLVNILDVRQPVELLLEGGIEGGMESYTEEDCTAECRTKGEYIVEQWQMSGFEPDAENSFEEPEKVVPVYTKGIIKKFSAKDDFPAAVSYDLEIPGCSVTVLKIHCGNCGN